MSGKPKLLETERKKIRSIVDKEAAEVATEAEFLISVVKQLNEGLVDQRLESKKGLLEVLEELRAYSRYLNKGFLIYLNGDPDRSGEMAIWFEA
jgi:hypothetical protein